MDWKRYFHTIHVWCIYKLVTTTFTSQPNVGKYTSAMDGMGFPFKHGYGKGYG